MIFNWLSVLVGVFYIILGVFVVIYKFFLITLEPNIAYPLGGLLILYGLFRVGRAVYRMRQNQDEA